MKHPTSELAEYLDGALSSEARASVDAHLGTCATCRDELRVATAARAVLKAQPAIVAPPAVGMAAIAEARAAKSLHTRHEAARRVPTQLWARWAAVAGVAAGVLLLAVVVLPNVGDGNGGGIRSDAVDDTAAAGPATAVEIVDGDLDTAALQQLAIGYRTEGGAGAEGPIAESTNQLVVTDTKASQAVVDEAIACLEQAFERPLPAPPVRLLEARVAGQRSILGVVLTGPGAGQPPDTAEVYVATLPGCEAGPFTYAKL